MIDFDTFKLNAEERVKELIKIDSTSTKLMIGKSQIIFADGYYSILTNNKEICNGVSMYSIALLLAENKINKNDALLLDNEYNKHYTDILLYSRYDSCINDAKLLESIIKLSNLIKKIKSIKTLSSYFDKYKK